jgi:putative nucleotidyltransferase with HDIG domain
MSKEIMDVDNKPLYTHLIKTAEIAEYMCKQNPLRNTIVTAAFLHDVGKTKTYCMHHNTMTYYNHAIVGYNMTDTLINGLSFEVDVCMVKSLVRNHMYYYKPCMGKKAVKRLIHILGVNEDNINDISNTPQVILRKADRISRGCKKISYNERLLHKEMKNLVCT